MRNIAGVLAGLLLASLASSAQAAAAASAISRDGCDQTVAGEECETRNQSKQKGQFQGCLCSMHGFPLQYWYGEGSIAG